MVHINIKQKVFDVLVESKGDQSWSKYLEDKLIKDIGNVPTNKDFEMVINNNIKDIQTKVEQLNDMIIDIKERIGY